MWNVVGRIDGLYVYVVVLGSTIMPSGNGNEFNENSSAFVACCFFWSMGIVRGL